MIIENFQEDLQHMNYNSLNITYYTILLRFPNRKPVQKGSRMMSKKNGYRTITYRFRLYCEHMHWLKETKQMYNRVLAFYYNVISSEPAIWEVPKLQMMRQLELLTVGARGEESTGTKYPVPFEKEPLYFRRAAINDAIRLQGSLRSGEEKGAKPAESFDASPIYYKGMYKEFTGTSVRLKLYNGDKWVWENCIIDTCGRSVPSEEQMMSPIIVPEKGRAMLHIPVKEEVEDVRTVKERLEGKEKICAIYFPNSDTMAVMVVLDSEGRLLASKFIHGGKELAHRKQVLLDRITENRRSMGYGQEEQDRCVLPEDENKSIKEKIHRITDNVAHKVSREIVEFCKEQQVSIIVVPNYKQSMDFNHIGYIAATSYDWLGRRIISYTRYKAFGEGIVTATASTKDIASRCHKCGEPVKSTTKTTAREKTSTAAKTSCVQAATRGIPISTLP